jgi:hypothetical protein
MNLVDVAGARKAQKDRRQTSGENKECKMHKLPFLLTIMFMLSLDGLSQHHFQINIDAACFQSNEEGTLDGTFGLYGDMSIPEHPFWVEDTLIQKLEFKKEQVLNLEPMQYTIRFTPNDSMERSHSVQVYSQTNYHHLSCFFFNKSYPLRLKDMQNNEYVKIVSRYAGPTNMATVIPIYTLMIVYKRGKYYARFWESASNEQGLPFIDEQYQPVEKNKIKMDDDYVKLNEEQLRVLEEFWGSMHKYWLDQDYSSTMSHTTITGPSGFSSFQSNAYISQLLWEKLK